MEETQASEKRQSGNFDIYEYIFKLEEQVKLLSTEKSLVSAKALSLELELERMRQEMRGLKAMPLIIGTIQEVCESGAKAVVKNSNGLECYIPVPEELKQRISAGSRVAMSQRSLAIVEVLPDAKDFRAAAMEVIERPKTTFEQIGGLGSAIRELDEAIVLPLTEPERLAELGIAAPSGVLLYGQPGTGKTLLAKAIANRTNSTFISLAGSELVRKYIGEGAELVRDVFKLAKERKQAIIFIDELDAIAAERFPASSGDREVQRTLMQLLAEMDGFNERGNVKLIAATNRIDIIDPAMLRPGRFDRIVKIPLPDEAARAEIFAIHTAKMRLAQDVSAAKLAALTESATGADIRAICSEAGMFALRAGSKRIALGDFTGAISKVLGTGSEDSPATGMFS